MSKVWKLLNEVRKDEEGAVLVEYISLVGIVAALIAAAVFSDFSGAVHSKFTAICTSALNSTC